MKNICELEKNKKRIKEERIIIQHLGLLSDLMSDFRTHLISRIRPTLSSYSSDFFESLTDGKYSVLELDENYNLMVYDNGLPFSIERFSGGEEDLVNLCLRLAISEVITERAGGAFNFIILDEIFGSQDALRRQNIMKALNSLTSKFRQIFLITHVDDVKNYMENIIFVSENEFHLSAVAGIEIHPEQEPSPGASVLVDELVTKQYPCRCKAADTGIVLGTGGREGRNVDALGPAVEIPGVGIQESSGHAGLDERIARAAFPGHVGFAGGFPGIANGHFDREFRRGMGRSVSSHGIGRFPGVSKMCRLFVRRCLRALLGRAVRVVPEVFSFIEDSLFRDPNPRYLARGRRRHAGAR